VKTLSVTKARQNLGEWVKRAIAGDDVGILYGDRVVALRPVEVHSDDYALREYAVTAEELDRRRPLTPDERAEAEALLDTLEHEELEEEQSRGQASRGLRHPAGSHLAAANESVRLRLPLSIYRHLIERAKAEHTSLNQLILSFVYRGLGQDAEGNAVETAPRPPRSAVPG